MVATAARALTPLHLSGASLVWGALVFAGGFWLPAYRMAEEVCQPARGSECGVGQESWSTLISVNGPGVLYVLATPLIASILVTGLVFASSRVGEPARWLAWCVVVALWAVSLLGAASVGLFLVPSAVLLTIAVGRLHTARGRVNGLPG